MSKLNWNEKSSAMDLWVEERHKDYYGTRFRCEKILFSGKSAFQHIDVIQTKAHGKMLLNDGIVMLSEKDEFVYHEMMAHVPLFVHPRAEAVLIIGGGDGGVATEVLRHGYVNQCTLVEIDQMVIDVAQKYFQNISVSFKNPKLQLKVQDGIGFVETATRKFDVALVDSTDPFGPAKGLFSESFYKNVFNILKEDGLLVVQAESPFFEIETQKFILESLSHVFPFVYLYNYSNTVYPGGLWSFAFASKKYHPIIDFQKEKLRQSPWSFSYYNEGIHQAAFAQPEFVKKELREYLSDLIVKDRS